MLSFILIALALIGTSLGVPLPSERIVGGKNATEGQFPWAVALREQWSWYHFCSGSIMSNYWILTAANCVYDKKPHHMHVSLGSVDLYPVQAKHDVYEIYVHDYHPNNFTNDVALLNLITPIEYTEMAKPIALSNSWISGGVEAKFSGWGWLTAVGGKPTNLQYLDVHTVNFEECQDAHAPYPVFDEEQICTLASIKHGACDQDGGAALVINGNQVGIFSWLRPCAIGIPDVFTRISHFLPWITKTMKQ